MLLMMDQYFVDGMTMIMMMMNFVQMVVAVVDDDNDSEGCS